MWEKITFAIIVSFMGHIYIYNMLHSTGTYPCEMKNFECKRDAMGWTCHKPYEDFE